MIESEITQWLADNNKLLGLEVIELISEKDLEIYQQFEIRRLFQDIIDYDLTSIEVYRDPEYAYDAKDHCYCCGYFEKNEFHPARYGYCSKFGTELNPRTVSCDVMIIL